MKKEKLPFLMYDTSHGGEDELIDSCMAKSSVTTFAVLITFVMGFVTGVLI